MLAAPCGQAAPVTERTVASAALVVHIGHITSFFRLMLTLLPRINSPRLFSSPAVTSLRRH